MKKATVAGGPHLCAARRLQGNPREVDDTAVGRVSMHRQKSRHYYCYSYHYYCYSYYYY